MPTDSRRGLSCRSLWVEMHSPTANARSQSIGSEFHDYGRNFAGRVNISMMPTDSRRGLSCRSLWVEMHSHRQDRYRCVTRRQLTRYAMPWRQQASRPIQCRSCTGSMPLRGVLRRSRLPERNRHAGDFWRPNACFDDRVGAGRAGVVAQASCQRCVSHSSCSRPVVGCHRMRTCVHCKPRNHGRTTRQRMSLRSATHSGSAFTHRYRTAR